MSCECNRFEGKTAVVTGAGSGIGLATAELMIAGGARVVAVDVSKPRLDEAAARIGASYVPVVADITKPEASQSVADAAGASVDILVNNAGIMDGFLPVGELDDATWDKVLGVNLTGMMRMMRQFVPGMVAAGHGAIVNLASEAALRACAGAAYAASKAGVVGLTRQTAAQYAKDHIRCNAVAPGGVATNVDGEVRSTIANERLMPAMGATMMTVNGFGQPEMLAEVICFLADDKAASFVNGIVVPVDGGWSAI